jgi:hypothetical protein
MFEVKWWATLTICVMIIAALVVLVHSENTSPSNMGSCTDVVIPIQPFSWKAIECRLDQQASVWGSNIACRCLRRDEK